MQSVDGLQATITALKAERAKTARKLTELHQTNRAQRDEIEGLRRGGQPHQHNDSGDGCNCDAQEDVDRLEHELEEMTAERDKYREVVEPSAHKFWRNKAFAPRMCLLVMTLLHLNVPCGHVREVIMVVSDFHHIRIPKRKYKVRCPKLGTEEWRDIPLLPGTTKIQKSRCQLAELAKLQAGERWIAGAQELVDRGLDPVKDHHVCMGGDVVQVHGRRSMRICTTSPAVMERWMSSAVLLIGWPVNERRTRWSASQLAKST